MVELRVKELRSIVSKGVGLLASKKAEPILLKTRFGIHTFGMRYPIDVLILDSHMTVVRLVKQLSPNRIFVWSPIYDHVIELPEGTIQKHNIIIGDRIKLLITE